MKVEFEIRAIEINFEELIKKAEDLGAISQGWLYQKRIVFDFSPSVKNKWVRLRDDGQKVTIAVKEILNSSISGTQESEIEVKEFENTKVFLEDLGFEARCYQENKRYKMMLGSVELDFDFWPKIPPILEIEGKNKEDVIRTISLLGIEQEKITSMGIESIYYEKYGIDLNSMNNLLFE